MAGDVTICEHDDWWVQMAAVTVADFRHLNTVAQTRDWNIDDTDDHRVLLAMAAHPDLSLVSAVYIYQMFGVADIGAPFGAGVTFQEADHPVPAALRKGIAHDAYRLDDTGHLSAHCGASVLRFADSALQVNGTVWALPPGKLALACDMIRRRQVAPRIGGRVLATLKQPANLSNVLPYPARSLAGRRRLNPAHPLAPIEHLFRADHPIRSGK